MSLILEALRRSEVERRRGAPPSLLGDPAPARVASSSNWSIALAGLVAGLLLAAAGAWWWTSRAEAPRSDDASVRPPPAVAPLGRLEPPPSAVYAPPPATLSPAAAAAPVDGPIRSRATSSPPLPSPPREASSATAVATLPALPAVMAQPESGSGPREGDVRWIEIAPDGLPPLRVSMHVYADEPARRFAIIDGQRYQEGDTLQPGLSLLEIRRDGLRLGWQDRVLWVPRG